MPSGEVHGGAACSRRTRQRGATYLLLLFLLAIMAAGMAAMGTQWAVAAQRERETELLFRGAEFSRALAGWRDATPAGEPSAPMQMQDLLVDQRSTPPRHHLRRLYPDPYTGVADWELLRGGDGRIVAVASRVRLPALRRVHRPLRAGADPEQPSVGDWIFEAAPRPAGPGKPPSGTKNSTR
jgi:type II secretory pathway pseudopilin PulG